MKTWSKGIIYNERTKIDSLNFSLQYGNPCVWEGIRSYTQNDGTTKVWKLREHAERLLDSAKIIGSSIPYTAGEIERACEALVEANGGGDLYLRPVAYSAQDAESVRAQNDEMVLDIYCFPIKPLHGGKDGIRMAISNVVRGYPQFQMQSKTAANYSSAQLVKGQLKALGVDDVFLLDNLGYAVEATVANFFVIKGDVIMTPPNNGSILPGITRRCIAEILQNQPLMFTKYQKTPLVVEKQITRADLYTADEVFLCGTYAEIAPVLEIDGRSIGDGKIGFYTKMLKQEYTNLIRGI